MTQRLSRLIASQIVTGEDVKAVLPKEIKTRLQVRMAASRKAWATRKRMKLARAIREHEGKPDIPVTATDIAQLHTEGGQGE